MSDTANKDKILYSRSDLVIGIDIRKSYSVVSYLYRELNDPGTITEEGSDSSRHIPLALAKEMGLGRWYVGDEAIQKARIDGAFLAEDLYANAYASQKTEIEGRTYSYSELLASYIRKIIDDAGFSVESIRKLVITLDEVDETNVELFSKISSHLGIARDVLVIIDHRESFIYYTLSQNSSIHQDDVALFDYEGERMLSCILSKEPNTRPQVIGLSVDAVSLDPSDRDKSFCEFISKVFLRRKITSVFLIGESFESDWMKDSVNVLCEDRRVFMGDNLYSKGACFAGRIRLKRRPWPYIHMGDHEMKMNLSLKVSNDNEMSFVTLVSAGENWYEAGGECEVILDGSPQFECWVQSPETRKSFVTMIELKKMPKRENRTSRLRISAAPVSSKQVKLVVVDLGFGDIAPSSTKVWEHFIDMVIEEQG